MNYLTISDYKIHEDPSFVHHPILSGCFGAQGHRTNTIQLMQLQLQLNAVATIENKPYSKSSVDHPWFKPSKNETKNSYCMLRTCGRATVGIGIPRS